MPPNLECYSCCRGRRYLSWLSEVFADGKTKDYGKYPKVDSELIYAYGKIDRLGNIEEFILMPNVANLPNVGDCLYDAALYVVAKIIFALLKM